ncbi:MAG: multimeric flavodoxin WrbA [Neolewinella sp.]|jgi:multimeric flavodoxin WrbA
MHNKQDTPSNPQADLQVRAGTSSTELQNGHWSGLARIPMPKPIILLASSRPNGDTRKVADHLALQLKAEVIDLTQFTIHPYRYEQDYPEGDDFFRVIETMVLPHDQIIFASPLYWYSMSGQMKIFFDRLSDLLESRKELGRQLRDKRMSVLSCANDEEITDTFYAAFRLTAEYLGMEYGPVWHGWVEEEGVEMVEKTNLD